MTYRKTDDILVNCITMLATVPFFEMPPSSNGEKCQKNGVLLRSGTNKNKRQGKGNPLMAERSAAENLNGVIVH